MTNESSQIRKEQLRFSICYTKIEALKIKS